MIALACFSLLCGAVLAQRFMVLVLLPAIALGTAAVIASAAATGLGAWWTLVAVCVVAVMLQIGYLIGIGTHAIVRTARANRKAALGGKARPQAA